MELTLSVRSFHVPATPGHLRLAAELAFGADLARHARHLGGERVELIHHRVDRCSSARRISPFTSTVILRDRSPLRDRGRHLGDVAHLRRSGCWPSS